MRILVIGDFHGKFPEKLKNLAKKSDLVLCIGDFGGSEELLKIIFKYLGEKWWKKIKPSRAKKYVLEDYGSGKKILRDLDKLGIPVYIIPGNWDFTSKTRTEKTLNLQLEIYQKIVRGSKNLVWWNRGIKRIGKLKILAFGGQVTAGDYLKKLKIFDEKKRKSFIKQNRRETKQIMKYGSKDIDILLAHYPPYGFFDIVRYKGENPMNGKHVGFKGYTEFIKKFQPKLFICGHMHEYQGMKIVGKTKIIAVGAAKDGRAALLEVDEKKRKIKKIEFVK